MFRWVDRRIWGFMYFRVCWGMCVNYDDDDNINDVIVKMWNRDVLFLNLMWILSINKDK